ncbi:hypothetical protein B0H12DRAFT_1112567 [Mycena haematopus]|nr:hypothetical protein B0H12DRAFT_1112567 [Mycena haematopus]
MQDHTPCHPRRLPQVLYSLPFLLIQRAVYHALLQSQTWRLESDTRAACSAQFSHVRAT